MTTATNLSGPKTGSEACTRVSPLRQFPFRYSGCSFEMRKQRATAQISVPKILETRCFLFCGKGKTREKPTIGHCQMQREDAQQTRKNASLVNRAEEGRFPPKMLQTKKRRLSGYRSAKLTETVSPFSGNLRVLSFSWRKEAARKRGGAVHQQQYTRENANRRGAGGGKE